MIFIINNLKYDTAKMEEVCSFEMEERLQYKVPFTEEVLSIPGKYPHILYVSKKGNWLITYKTDNYVHGAAISEAEAKSVIMKNCPEKYEELFGPIEEA